MKKKLLSLVLAGAMVASTSVSAFAQDKVINGSEKEEHKTQVTITGEVLGENNERPVGNLNVTVPTTATFTVSKTNGFISVPLNITNNGTQDIEVYADSFVDSTKTEGENITVVREAELTDKSRAYVSLRLVGGEDTAYLKTESEGNGKGIYKTKELNAAAEQGGIKLANIARGDKKELTLTGTAGSTGTVATAINDVFTLTLKIKKANPS